MSIEIKPHSSTLYGIDLSGWNGAVDWAQVPEDVAFAYIKASEGETHVSPALIEHGGAAGSRDAGLLTGCYHFVRFWYKGERRDPSPQAEHFVRQMERAGGTFFLPPAIDVEWHSGDYVKKGRDNAAYRVDFTLGMVERIEQLTGRLPILYTGRSYWKYKLARTTELAHLALWLARPLEGEKTGERDRKGNVIRYPVTRPQDAEVYEEPHVPEPWSRYTIWQFSHTGMVPGIKGKVDINLFRGSEEQLVNINVGADWK